MTSFDPQEPYIVNELKTADQIYSGTTKLCQFNLFFNFRGSKKVFVKYLGNQTLIFTNDLREMEEQNRGSNLRVIPEYFINLVHP